MVFHHQTIGDDDIDIFNSAWLCDHKKKCKYNIYETLEYKYNFYENWVSYVKIFFFKKIVKKKFEKNYHWNLFIEY